MDYQCLERDGGDIFYLHLIWGIGLMWLTKWPKGTFYFYFLNKMCFFHLNVEVFQNDLGNVFYFTYNMRER